MKKQGQKPKENSKKPMPTPEPKSKPIDPRKRVEERRKEVRELLMVGMPVKKMAEKLGTTEKFIRMDIEAVEKDFGTKARTLRSDVEIGRHLAFFEWMERLVQNRMLTMIRDTPDSVSAQCSLASTVVGIRESQIKLESMIGLLKERPKNDTVEDELVSILSSNEHARKAVESAMEEIGDEERRVAKKARQVSKTEQADNKGNLEGVVLKDDTPGDVKKV